MNEVLQQLLDLRKQDLDSAKEFRDEMRERLSGQDLILKDQNKTLGQIFTQTKLTNGRVNNLEAYRDSLIAFSDAIKKNFWRIVVGVTIVVIGAWAVGHFIH